MEIGKEVKENPDFFENLLADVEGWFSSFLANTNADTMNGDDEYFPARYDDIIQKLRVYRELLEEPFLAFDSSEYPDGLLELLASLDTVIANVVRLKAAYSNLYEIVSDFQSFEDNLSEVAESSRRYPEKPTAFHGCTVQSSLSN